MRGSLPARRPAQQALIVDLSITGELVDDRRRCCQLEANLPVRSRHLITVVISEKLSMVLELLARPFIDTDADSNRIVYCNAGSVNDTVR